MEPLNIREGATVYSADGEKLGKVVGLDGQNLIVEKGFFFPNDYAVPTSYVNSATDDDIYLTVTKDQALSNDWAPSPSPTAVANSAPLASAPTGDVAYAGTLETPAATTDTTAYDATATNTGDVIRVPVHEEELTATKRPVDKGQVRIDKDVVSEERTLDVPVTEERVHVTRRAVDRDATDTADAFDERTIDVPVQSEAVDVQKRTRVAEEVEISKEPVTRTERVSDTVRREEVHVDDQTTDTGSVSTS